jgi:hypothetical protein
MEGRQMVMVLSPKKKEVNTAKSKEAKSKDALPSSVADS